MNPSQFEEFVAQYYTSLGYVCELCGGSYDYGVDLIARDPNESIAIQVKMYEQREVNYQAIMYLYAGKDLHGCDNAIMISKGAIRKDAQDVAAKLDVDIEEYWEKSIDVSRTNIDTVEEPELTANHTEYLSFYDAWEKNIMPLKGKILYTARGNKNEVVSVTYDQVTRRSSNGIKSDVEIEIFEQVYNLLLEKSRVTRDEINHLFPGRASAFIVPLLAEIPFIEMLTRPARLELKSDSEVS